MRLFAQYTDAGRESLLQSDWVTLGRLMDLNFDLRHRLYGDECIGPRNLEMVALARRLGMPATFPGSGGAIVGICEDEDQFATARERFEQRGYQFVRLQPATREGCRRRELSESFVGGA